MDVTVRIVKDDKGRRLVVRATVTSDKEAAELVRLINATSCEIFDPELLERKTK